MAFSTGISAGGGGKIGAGPSKSPSVSRPSGGAPSRIGSTGKVNETNGSAEASAEALKFASPGLSPGQIAAKKEGAGNVATRFAKAEGAGSQNFAGGGVGGQIGAGGSNKPFIPLDSSKLGLQALGAAFAGAGDVLAAAMKAAQQKGQGGQEGARAGQDQMMAQADQMDFGQDDQG